MGKLLIPAVMAALGLGLGGGAALALRPGAPEAAPEAAPEGGVGGEAPEAAHGEAAQAEGAPPGEAAAPEAAPEAAHGAPEGGTEAPAEGAGVGPDYVKLDNQFVVPVIEGGRIEALVVMALNIEVEAGAREGVVEREPKLRDALLRVMFDHANAGGFSGGFTEGERVEGLRRALLEQARAVAGPGVRDVLILEIARQES